MKKVIILLGIGFINISCNGQKQEKCSSDIIVKKIKQLPQTIKDSIYVTKNKKNIIYQIDTDTIDGKAYKVIKQAVNDEFHVSTLHLYYVDENCNLFLYDTVEATLSPINKKQHNMETNRTITIEFTDLFNEGSNIKFTPNDLNKDIPEIKNFKKKLESYLNEYPLLEDFDIKNLSTLINNETFFDLQNYTDSSWLQYFITKYKVDVSKLQDLMNQAINQEDYNAVKTLVDNHYIVSKKDLQIVSETEQVSKNKIQENKKDGYESYLASKSKINQISHLLKTEFHSNKINDPDGYTNLRKDKNTSSEVLQKIKSGEYIEVLDNSGDWFLVKTKDGKQGYVHKSRVKSN